MSDKTKTTTKADGVGRRVQQTVRRLFEYEVFCTNFSQTIKAENVISACKKFRKQNPKEKIIFVDDLDFVRKNEREHFIKKHRKVAIDSDELNPLVIAFLQGAKFWEYHQKDATMWQSDQSIVINEGFEKLKSGSLGKLPENAA